MLEWKLAHDDFFTLIQVKLRHLVMEDASFILKINQKNGGHSLFSFVSQTQRQDYKFTKPEKILIPYQHYKIKHVSHDI